MNSAGVGLNQDSEKVFNLIFENGSTLTFIPPPHFTTPKPTQMSTSTGTAAIAAPVLQTQRIGIIDSLRGFAILGILLMNMPGFALPGPVAGDPTMWNELGTVNFKVYFLVEWIPEGTQRALFSMLFGAGILLFTSRLERRLDGVLPADLFMRRQLWLLVFGLVNIYILLWWGDILFDYGVCGMIMFTFRNLSSKKLLIGGIVCMMLMIARENRELYLEKAPITAGERIAAMDTTKTKLTDKQKGQLAEYNERKDGTKKDERKKRVDKIIEATTGSFADVYENRTGMYLNYMLVHYGYLSLWDVLMFMFFGMFFFKTGVITGEAPIRIYWILAVVGLGVGLWLSWYRIGLASSRGYNWFEITRAAKFEWYTLSRTLRSLGIFGTMILLYRSGWFRWLFALMRPVGQMAFTNYLTQSLICAIIFYGGMGMGKFGHMQRYEIYLVVGSIWIVQIIWSHVWLRFFLFGPLEWCWRSLTYWKAQPLRKGKLGVSA
ncbi:MAG: DUF418 domain-containing protein [Chitinophagaceae bacterium]|nr:MAG: DUF418 domain-containing protein [Chitinophagaceae bacterium]